MVLLLFFGGIAALHYQAGRLAEATKQAQDVGQVYEDLANFYVVFGGLRTGRSKFQQLANEEPENPWPLIKLAWLDYFTSIYYNLPDNFEAADQALLLDADNEPAFSELARFYFRTGQYGKMGQAAEKALSAIPDSAEATYWSGQALKYKGDFTGARQMFETCTELKAEDNWYQSMCYAELITATRTLTITLAKNHLFVQTWAKLDEFPAKANQYLTQGEPAAMVQELTWGQTRLSPGLSYLSESISDLDDSIIVENTNISNQGEQINYTYFWDLAYHRYEDPHLAIEALPLMAYMLPTTITIVTEGAQIISTTHPYQGIQGKQVFWQLNNLNKSTESIKLGAIIFILYLAPRLFPSEFMLIYLILSPFA